MARQITVDLVFNANTQQAQQQMRNLQTSISQMQSTLNSQISMNGLTQNLSQAQDAVISLKTNLQSAFNVDTGKLNLNKFNQNMQQSNQSLASYRQALQQLGPDGVKTFNQLAQSVLQAELPIQKTKNLLTNMLDTFGNSIKWSLAYGSIHKISQGFREAFQYAEDLNNSLTDIRVITGQSADEMTKFAEKANKAAKSLATSTTAYTEAALIYYRQGLDEQEVEKRTATTLKLANVVGQGAQEVSEWMTAIWNNFDDGSKSLEYYADVISKLGITTASSAEEIATGLEKFSAIANTVGLSYEYATSALATVTAQTRQSADVVGTAFKTLFARLQDLNLGNTLEDGTTLGQYSEALYKVGINIKDSAGNLKDMDNILDEMGGKWKSLDKDQQVALAKNVAGLRQYAQLVALMDNYDVFKENIETAKMAEGTLQDQQEVWAESWEAASKRVKVAAEGLYSDLINDKFFIDLQNVFADLINGVDKLLDTMGGLKTLLPLIAGWILKAFGPAAISAVTGFYNNLKGPSAAQIQAAQQTRTEALNQQLILARNTGGNESAVLTETLPKQLEFTKTIEGITRNLNKNEIEHLQSLKNQTFELQKQAQLYGQIVDALEEKQREIEKEQQIATNNRENVEEGFINNVLNKNKNLDAQDVKKSLRYDKAQMGAAAKRQASLSEFLEDNFIADDGSFNAEAATEAAQRFNPEKIIKTKEELSAYKEEMKSVNFVNEKADEIQGRLKEKFKTSAKSNKEYTDALKQEYNAKAETIKSSNKYITALEGQIANTDKAKEEMEKLRLEAQAMNKVPLGQTITSIAGSMGMLASGLSMGVNGVVSFVKEIKEGNLSLSTLLSTLTSIGMAAPLVVNSFKAISSAIADSTLAQKANIAANWEAISASWASTEAMKTEQLMKKFGLTLEEAEALAKAKTTETTWAQAAADVGGSVAKKAQTPGVIANTLAWIMNTFAIKSATQATWILLAGVVAIGAAIAGVIAVVKLLSNAYNADAIAAEKAKKHAEDTAKAYQEIKQAYDDLKSSIEDYNKAQLAIDKLTEGTKEWKDAIVEANQKVLEMMEKYPELAKYVENINGRLVISNEAQTRVLEEEQQRVIAAGLIKQDANLNARKTANTSRTTNLVRGELDTVNDIAVANAIAAAIATAPVSGGLSLLGALGIVLENNKSAKETQKTLKDLSNLQQGDFELIFGQESQEKFANLLEEKLDKVVSPELVEALYKNKDSVEELIKSNKDLKEVEEQLNQQKVDNLLMNTEIFNSSRYGKGAQQAALNIYNQIQKELENVSADDFRAHREDSRYNGKWAEENYFGTGWRATEAGKEAFKNYLINQGYSESEAEKAYKSANFKRNEIKYQGKDDSSKDSNLSYEDLASAAKDIAMAEKAVEIAERVNSYTNKVINLSRDYSKNIGENALSSYLENGDASLLTEEEYYTLKGKTKKELTKLVKESIDENTIKQFGAESIEDFVKGIQESIDGITETELKNNRLQKQWEEYQNTLKAGAEALGVNQAALEGYAEQLAKENNAGTENAKTMAELSVYHYKLAKGVSELRKVLQDNIELLHASTDDSLDYYEALGKVEEQLEKTFGVKVSSDFVKKNLSDIEGMANGDVEALQRLRQAVVKEFVIHITTDEQERNEILNSLQTLRDKIDNDLTAEFSLDNTKALDAINTALATGRVTIEEIESMFHNADLSMPQYKMANVPHKTRSETVSTLSGSIFGEGTEVRSTTDTITYTQVPYFGSNKPVYDVNEAGETKLKGYINTESKKYDANKSDLKNLEAMGDAGVGTGPIVSGTGNIRSLKDITNYDGKSDAQKAADNKKKLSDLDKELDRYHEINEILSDTERQLDRISKAKDRVYGSSRLALMDNEIAKQKEIIANNRTLLSEAEAYLVQDRNKLLSQFAVNLDSTGRITNYEELQQNYINRLKGAINNETQYERIENEYNAFKDAASQYEETLNKVEEQVEKVNDEMDKLYEFNLEKIQYTVEIKVDIAEDDKSYIDFLMQKVDNDAFAAADAIALLGRETGDVIQQISAYEQGIADTEAAYARGDITQAQAVERLREYRDELIEANSSLLELRQSVQDKLTEAFDAWNEKLDKSRDKIEHLSSILEHYKNIIDIIGKDQLGISNELMKQLRGAQLANAKDALAAARSQKEAIDQTLAGYRAAREAATDEESRKEWDKQIELAEEKATEAADAFRQAFETALELTKENFQSTVNEIVEEFEKSVSGIYGTLDALQEEWDRQQEVAERYLATYEQTYEINKLNRKIQQDIEKSNNIGNQKQLRSLQAEMLEMTKDGQRLSKYDLEYLQKRYDLLVAEQALRDAQNAKSVVRLQRDSEGNFGYVYTADQSAVDGAQQKYEDALYAMEKYGADSIKQLNNQLIQINKEFVEAVKEVSEDETLTLDERERKIEELTAFYSEKTRYLVDEAQKMLQRGSEMTELYNADMAKDFNETLLGKMRPDLESYESLYKISTEAMQDATTKLQSAIVNYGQEQSLVFDDAGLDIKEYSNTVLEEYQKIQKESKKTAQETNEMANNMKTSMNNAISYVEDFQKSYSSQMETIRTNTQATIEKVNALVKEYGKLAQAEAERNYQNATGNNGYQSSGTGNNEYQSGGTRNNNVTYMHSAAGTAASNGKAVGRVSASVDSPGTTWTNKDTNYTFFRDLDGTLYVRSNTQTNSGEYYWYKYSELKDEDGGDFSNAHIYKGQQRYKKANYAFDTGGYTGSWGPEGRLAMLHQKELVLNAHDTENFLTAIGIVRDISDQIEKNAIVMQTQNAFANYRATVSNSSDTLQQEVTIHAEFPNATDHNEIEEAFRNLTNYASQYANRKS